MKVSEIIETLNATLITGEERLEMDVMTACGSDLMSDVLAFVKDRSVLITGLVNPQVVRTAEMMDIRCIVCVRGKEPSDQVIELAREHGIALLKTEHRMYVACGLLYEKGLNGDGDINER